MSRVVLLLGGSSGIGRATAHLLHERGDTVVLASRGKAALEATAAELGGAEVHPVDVRDGDAVQSLVDEVVARHGRLDAVVSTAGVVSYGRFEDVPPEVFDGVLETNLLGAANVARAVVPVLRRQRKGTLVLVGSVLGDIAAPRMTPYVVSKWGVRALGRQLALENRDLPDVHVTVLSPGGVDTPIYVQAANYQGREGRPPMPVDSPEKLARAVVATLDKPRDRVSVGRLNPLMRLGFSLTPRIFDAIVGPLFEVLASKPVAVGPTTGNVLEPVDDREAVTGNGSGAWRDLVARVREV